MNLIFALVLSTLAFASELNIRINSEPPTLDWNLATDIVSGNLIDNMMEGLAGYDADMKPKPALAESWSVSKDGKTYTYKLRKGVVWSDGVPLKAQHFVDSWLRLINPKTAAEYAYFLFDIKNAKEFNEGKITDPSLVGVLAKDDNTLVVTLKQAASYFPTIPANMVTYPIRKELVEKHGSEWTKPENIKTLGPYLLSEWKHDSRITLTTNPKFYGRKPKIEKINGMIVLEDTTAVTLFETGKVQFVNRVPPLDVPRLRKNPAFQNLPSYEVVGFQFNVSKKPFDNPKVRQAFSLAIDREEIAKLLKGGQTATTNWIPQGLPGYDPKVGLHFQLEKARKLLAEAGYPEGKGFPAVTLLFSNGDARQILSERMQEMWKKNLGVRVSLQTEDWKVYLKHILVDAPQIFVARWVADYPDPDNFMNLYTSFCGNNNSTWKNKEYDDLIAQGAAERRPAKRLEIYRKAQSLLLEKEAVVMPIYGETMKVLVSPKVSGIVIAPSQMVRFKDAEVM